jgi:hypothetical protein
MRRSCLLSFLGVLLVATVRASSDSNNDSTLRQDSDSTSLIGTWRLLIADDREDEKHDWQHSYGEHPRGYIVYDTTGHIFVQFCSDPPTPPFLSGDFNPTAAEAKSAYLNYVAYFGTYSVDSRRHVVTHHVEGSLVPSYTATDQERPFQLHGDRLELTDGKTWRRVWVRVPSPGNR